MRAAKRRQKPWWTGPFKQARKRLRFDADTAEVHAAYFIPKTPLGRAGLPKDTATVTSFALSEDAYWLTACTIDAAGDMVF